MASPAPRRASTTAAATSARSSTGHAARSRLEHCPTVESWRPSTRTGRARVPDLRRQGANGLERVVRWACAGRSLRPSGVGIFADLWSAAMPKRCRTGRTTVAPSHADPVRLWTRRHHGRGYYDEASTRLAQLARRGLRRCRSLCRRRPRWPERPGRSGCESGGLRCGVALDVVQSLLRDPEQCELVLLAEPAWFPARPRLRVDFVSGAECRRRVSRSRARARGRRAVTGAGQG